MFAFALALSMCVEIDGKMFKENLRRIDELTHVELNSIRGVCCMMEMK